jgi:hypothetical protein
LPSRRRVLHPSDSMLRRSIAATAISPAWLALALLSLTGCAARVGGDVDGGDRDGGTGDAGMRDAGRDVRFRDVPSVGDDAFVEDPCPEAGMSVREYRCDPFSQAGCDPGDGCYPRITYTMDRCARERFGAECRPAGGIAVGAACGGAEPCVPGASCFATGSGTRCLRLCRLDGAPPTCPRGAVCEPTDNPDIGACD